MKQLWADIEGYPNYAVSNLGYVMRVPSGKLLALRPSTRGYLRVALSNSGMIKDFYIHHLVADAFIPGFRFGMQVRHLDSDKTHNWLDNLEVRNSRNLYDPEYDIQETWGQRIVILETGHVFRSVRDCANYIGGDYSTIYRCLRGERKKHLGFTFAYYEGP